MNLTIVLEGLQEDLQGLAELGDERSAQIARRLGDALGSNLRLKLLDLLSQAALELNSKLPSGHIEVRLAGQEPELVFVDAAGRERRHGRRGALGADQPAPPRVAEDGGREGSGRARGSRRTRGSSARSPARPSRAPSMSAASACRATPRARGSLTMQKTFDVQGPAEVEIRLNAGEIEVDAIARAAAVEVELTRPRRGVAGARRRRPASSCRASARMLSSTCRSKRGGFSLGHLFGRQGITCRVRCPEGSLADRPHASRPTSRRAARSAA